MQQTTPASSKTLSQYRIVGINPAVILVVLSAAAIVPRNGQALVIVSPEKLTKPITLLSTLVHFGFSLLLFKHFDPDSAGLQLVEKVPWLKELGVSYFVGVDGISFWLILLTTFLTPIVVAASWSTINKQVKGFHIAILILESAMIGSLKLGLRRPTK